MIELIRFQNITDIIAFSESQINFLEKLKPLTGDEWDKVDDQISEVKKVIKEQLSIFQKDYCIYCGIHTKIVGPLERDHIAPKNARKYPEYMFEPKNLVLACHFCNGSSKKGQRDTIAVKHDKYDKCKFSIIHPYFDDFKNHIVFSRDDQSVIIKHKTTEGENTINMFDLNNEFQAELRGKMLNLEKYQLVDELEYLVETIVTSQYST